MAQCAVAVALPVTDGTVPLFGQRIFEFSAIAAMAGWPPRMDYDPPRPIA